jgi:hypothetical protein
MIEIWQVWDECNTERLAGRMGFGLSRVPTCGLTFLLPADLK